jgi:hypothetical protein
MKTCVMQPMMYPHCRNTIAAIIVNALVQYPWLFATLANVTPTIMSKPAGTRTKTLNRKLIKKPAPVLMMMRKVSMFPPSAGAWRIRRLPFSFWSLVLWRTNNVATARLLQRKKGRCALLLLRDEVTLLKMTDFFDHKQKGLGYA